MLLLLCSWIGLSLLLVLICIGRQKDGGALTLSYFLILSLLHVPGAIAYVTPSSVLIYDEETRLGFEMTVIGMASFIAGVTLVRVLGRHHAVIPQQIADEHKNALQWVSYVMIISGFLVYFVALPILKFVPSLTSLLHPLAALMVLGFWIILYLGIVLRDPNRTYGTFLITPVLPVLTTITGGFIGFGVYWAMTIAAFYATSVRKWMWMLAVAPVVAYLGLSLFVTYMRDRELVRDTVWYEQNYTLGERFSRFWNTVTNFELLDFDNPEHLLALHARLNQNYFVGLAVQRHEEGSLELLYGSTAPIWGLIPRVFWPDKPDVGGGRTVVKDITGLDLAEGTSFGAGQILEFYANFGTIGVIIGMSALGALLAFLDRAIIRSLNKADIRKLLLFAMPGFVLLQPSGNLLEIMVSAVAAVIGASLLGLILSDRLNRLVLENKMISRGTG